MRFVNLLAGLLLCSLSVYGQEALNLPFTHYYTYSGESIPDELYQFPAGDTDEMIADILTAGGKDRNFTAYASNVATIALLRNGDQRYLLYNRLYLLKQPYDLYRYTLLAHAIGHHVNEDQLLPRQAVPQDFARSQALREAEELQADEFAGYVLFNLGIPEAALNGLPLGVPLGHMIDAEEREASMRRGYGRAEAYVLLAPSAAYHDDGSGNAVTGIREFPSSPPRASASYDLTSHFSRTGRLGQIAERIHSALAGCGYYEHQYYYLEGGFALVTRIEQFNRDGSSMSEPARWSARPVRDENFNWRAYLRSLFTSDPGHFRVFVFMVTNRAWTMNTSHQVSREDAENWLSEGANRLPETIANREVPSGTNITALVYEFTVEESTGEARLSLPSELSSYTHLLRSNIINHLSR